MTLCVYGQIRYGKLLRSKKYLRHVGSRGPESSLLDRQCAGIKEIPRLESHWNSFFARFSRSESHVFLATCGGARAFRFSGRRLAPRIFLSGIEGTHTRTRAHGDVTTRDRSTHGEGPRRHTREDNARVRTRSLALTRARARVPGHRPRTGRKGQKNIPSRRVVRRPRARASASASTLRLSVRDPRP